MKTHSLFSFCGNNFFGGRFSHPWANACNGGIWHDARSGSPSPTTPDLADILDRMDFDIDNSYLLDFLASRVPDFQVPRFDLAWAWAAVACKMCMSRVNC